MFEVRFMATPSFIRGLFDHRMIRPTKDVTGVCERVTPEFSAEKAAIEKAPDHIAVCCVGAFTNTILK